jgi:hypothetical protein
VNRDLEDGDFSCSDVGSFDDPYADKFSTLFVNAHEDQVFDYDLCTQPSTDQVPDALIQVPALEQSDNHNQENFPSLKMMRQFLPLHLRMFFHPVANPLPTIGLRAIGLCTAHWTLKLVASIAGSFSCRPNPFLFQQGPHFNRVHCNQRNLQ